MLRDARPSEQHDFAGRRLPRWLRRAARAAASRLPDSSGSRNWSDRIRRFTAEPDAAPGDRYIGWTRFFSDAELATLARPALGARIEPFLDASRRASFAGGAAADPVDGAFRVDLDAYLPDDLLAMVAAWGVRIGVQPKRVRMRTMYSRWGSCSSKGNINLNRALCYLPPRLAEYVVCHELVHLRVFNHSKAFKEMMSQYMPDWKTRERELKGYHP